MADQDEKKMGDGEPKAQGVSDKEIKKIDDKIEAAEKKIEAKTGERVNIIGDMGKPNTDDPKEVREYLKRLDEKIDRILAVHEKSNQPSPGQNAPLAEKPKGSFWDRELL